MKQKTMVAILFIAGYGCLYAEPSKLSPDYTLEDWLTPHINIGTLERVDYYEVTKNILKTDPLPFIAEYGEEYKFWLKNWEDVSSEYFSPERAYKQYDKKSKTALYRLFFRYRDPKKNYNDETFQMVYYANGEGKTNVIYAGFYHQRLRFNGESSENIMPIIKNDEMFGLVIYSLDDEYTHEGYIILADDILKMDIINRRGFRTIPFRISEPLVDRKDIYKYTAQNMFDGNPATSYVEDTDDDLIEIKFFFNMDPFLGEIRFRGTEKTERFEFIILKQGSIINGYASNEKLYYANNRVARITAGSWSAGEWDFDLETELKDGCLTKQLFDCEREILKMESVYKGTKYNDTCIAELNLKISVSRTDEESMKKWWLFGHEEWWLFGDDDE